jgi:hypothetical protein
MDWGLGAGLRDGSPIGRRPLPVSPEEWHVITTAHPNLLVEGPESATDETIVALVPHLRGPVHFWEPGIALHTPGQRKASLLLRHANQLSLPEQRAVLGWMDVSMCEGQTVAMSCDPLFALVARGLFVAELYYRLNMLRVELPLPTSER